MIFLPLRLSAASTRAGRVLPGLLLCCSLAAISTAIAAWGGSSVVWALLIGAAIASVRVPSVRWAPGVEFAGKHVLRLGVALLGLQISAAAFQVLNLAKVVALAADVATVLVIGRLLGPVMGIEKKLALVLAASVAICGASAAAAFAPVLTPDDISGFVPRNFGASAASLSRFCLVSGMGAIGLTLPWRSLAAYGWRPVAMGIQGAEARGLRF
jgi:uncharacterized membrane protein YadS